MQVRDIMIHPVVTVPADTSLESVARLLLDKRIGCVPVVDDAGELIGIVTESDFSGKDSCFPFSTFRWPKVFQQWMPKEGLEQVYEQARQVPARDVMTGDVQTVTEDDTLETVVQRMVENDLHRIPVVRKNIPVGIVSRHDLLRLMLPSVRK